MKFRQMKNTQPNLHSCKKHSKSQQRKLRNWLMGGAILAATMPTAKCPVLIHVARADFYHAVEPGETLRSVANRYGMRSSALRTANKLEDTRDNAPLPAMLLRIPDGKKSEAEIGPEITPVKSAAEITPEITATGSISKTVRYTVQEGDTLDTIAHRYAQSGYPVTVEAIAEKNHLTPEPNIQPAIGSSIIIPLQSVTYRASAQQSASRKVPAHADNELTISGEVPVSMAQVVAEQQPVYQSITKPPKTASRRGYSLGARGNMPVGGRDGVRVLKQNEDALNTAPPPQSQPRVMQAPSSTTVGALAQVAQVALAGAKIRRLPEADSYALYKCPVGTELAIIKQNGGWSAILMSDRSTGWIPTRYLKFTGASVDISSQVVTGSAAWSGRPSNDSGTNYNGHYYSDNPMVTQALAWLGTPYVYGGEGRRGIDCSSLVQHAFAACGYRLPRTAAEQARVGRAVDPAQLRAGDRLYFSASGTRIDHTGLYMGNGLFVEASGRRRGVIVSNLFDASHWNIFVCARR